MELTKYDIMIKDYVDYRRKWLEENGHTELEWFSAILNFVNNDPLVESGERSVSESTEIWEKEVGFENGIYLPIEQWLVETNYQFD